MKFIIRLFALLAFFTMTQNSAFAQKAEKTEKAEKTSPIITTEFEVTGVCKMCKKRIENAALVKGVKVAEWDKNTQMLKVIYDSRKTTVEMIHQYVAAYGHDTDKAKAPDGVYNKLPGCCKYRDGVKVH